MPGHENERTRYEYDEYKRVTKITNPLGKDTSYDYTPVSNPSLGPLSHTTSSVYRVTSHMGKVTEYDYDANFRRKRMTVGANTAEAATTTYTYDEVGNQTTVTEPNAQPGGIAQGHHSTAEYDDRNRRTGLTDALGHKTEWGYDDVGNMRWERRADLKSRTWDLYDAMNRVKQTTGFLNEVTLYDYDPAGNQTKMTVVANGGIYETVYDELNRKKNAIYPPDSLTGQSQSEAWRYDIAGNLKWYKNPAYQFKHFEYDVRNRQHRSYWNSSSTDTTPDWSAGDETWTAFDGASRVTAVNTVTRRAAAIVVTTAVGYGYDDANHKVSETQMIVEGTSAALTRTVETLPDDDGNRRTLSVAGVPDGGYAFTYEYTQRQQLRHINRGGSAYFEYSYDKTGNLKKRQHMAGGQGLNATRFEYDAGNRVTFCEQKQSEAELFAQSNYNDYDAVNNLKSISRLEDYNKGELFEYDDANQLKNVSYKADVGPHGPEPGGGGEVAEVEKDTAREALAALEADPDREPLAKYNVEPEAAAGPYTVAYTNDAINRLSVNDSRGTVINYTPNGLNQYTAVSGFTPPSYDANFNLSGYTGWTFIYDADKRLKSAYGNGHNAQFVYDGLGRCVRRTIDTVTTVLTYDEWKPIAEWTGAGGFVAWNLYGPGADEILVRNQPDPAGYLYYHLDAMGNVVFLLSQGSQAMMGLEKYTYDAFGKPTITGWNGNVRPISNYGNRFLFTGREYLYTLGLYDYRHRHYHPGLGRFIQTDPIGFKGDPMNLYRYCGGNPINHSDPTGLYGEEISNLEEAIHVARIRVMNEVRNPNRPTVDLHVDSGGAGRTIRYAPGVSVSVLKAKSGNYELSKTLHGTPQKIQGKWYDTEPVVKGAVLPVHSHHDTGNGIGAPGWSGLDIKLKMVERMDESKPGWWHRGGLKNGVFTESGKPQYDDGSRRASDSNQSSQDSLRDRSAPSASQVDARHQATGVPSLAAESVNRYNGVL
jgi:RHS repeat-associated protein